MPSEVPRHPQPSSACKKACYEAIKRVDPGILVESAPATRPNTQYNRALLKAGIGKYADLIGTHMYGVSSGKMRSRHCANGWRSSVSTSRWRLASVGRTRTGSTQEAQMESGRVSTGERRERYGCGTWLPTLGARNFTTFCSSACLAFMEIGKWIRIGLLWRRSRTSDTGDSSEIACLSLLRERFSQPKQSM
ncbi:MAG: hypothetical protein N4J56_006734 [Chroococcidiopsis sp. SAG 2025]|nr:hypothetical protein [Chroococcidiopsis sp. SAG 2025]